MSCLNDHYRPALSLCELILRDSSMDIEKEGEKNSLSFLINMETLFQDFVANMLKMKFGDQNVALQKTEYFDTNRQLKGKSDIELTYDKSSVILDTKYKHIGNANPPFEHVMQVHSYSIITNARPCILINAASENITMKKYDLKDNICLFTLHFNLACSSKMEFDENCLYLLNEIMNIL
jgi:5-methylcytosine-specific restriction endonuclease McrBC regulatory subunit McrC